MTTEIARFMVALEQTWDAHHRALYVDRDPEAALAHAVAEPSVRHLPTGAGAEGRNAVAAFLAQTLLPHLPDDLAWRRVSRTVDRFRLVDETTVTFTHDRELPWLLPGTAATHRPVEALAITVVSFRRREIQGTRTLWDLATLRVQLGLEPLSTVGAER